MPTPTYNLPLIDPASPINIVNDMNALATAVDSALAQKPDAGDINQIRTQASQAQKTADKAASDATKAVQASNSASSSAQTAISTAAQAVTTANDVETMLKLTLVGKVASGVNPVVKTWNGDVDNPVFSNDSGTCSYALNYALNSDGSYGKLYGRVSLLNVSTSGTVNAAVIFPAGSIPIKRPSSNFFIDYTGMIVPANTDYGVSAGGTLFLNDGRVAFIFGGLTNYKATNRLYVWPAFYSFTSFGDAPDVENYSL